MSKFLYDVQQENRLEQKGLLRRFSIICYGHQESREDMRAEKTIAFQKLKNKKDSKEYEEWFLNYKPTPVTKKIILKDIQSNKNNKSKKIKINIRKKNKTKRNLNSDSDSDSASETISSSNKNK
jgi:hypothetical protein